MYLVVYGLGKFIKFEFLAAVKDSPVFSVSFDESLKDVAQECQMDVAIRFCSQKSSTVETRYLDSRFLNRPNSENLCNEILNTV